jgi:hypothetical protein
MWRWAQLQFVLLLRVLRVLPGGTHDVAFRRSHLRIVHWSQLVSHHC